MSALSLLFELYANIHPEPGYWIETAQGDSDGENYCRKCALKRQGDGHLCTYGTSSEQDSCMHCADCGVMLDYTLTNHGADAELEHFSTVKFRRNKPLDRETAYHLARLIAAKETLEVVTIAARAIRCMRRIPTHTKGDGHG